MYGRYTMEEDKAELEDKAAPKYITERKKILENPNPNRPKTVVRASYLDDISKYPRDLKSQLTKYMNPENYNIGLKILLEKQKTTLGEKIRGQETYENVERDLLGENPPFEEFDPDPNSLTGFTYDRRNMIYQREIDRALNDETRRAMVANQLRIRSEMDPTSRLGLLTATDRTRLNTDRIPQQTDTFNIRRGQQNRVFTAEQIRRIMTQFNTTEEEALQLAPFVRDEDFE